MSPTILRFRLCAVLCVAGAQSMYPERRTRVVSKTLQPVWNESFVWEGIDECMTLKVELFAAAVARHVVVWELLP